MKPSGFFSLLGTSWPYSSIQQSNGLFCSLLFPGGKGRSDPRALSSFFSSKRLPHRMNSFSSSSFSVSKFPVRLVLVSAGLKQRRLFILASIRAQEMLSCVITNNDTQLLRNSVRRDLGILKQKNKAPLPFRLRLLLLQCLDPAGVVCAVRKELKLWREEVDDSNAGSVLAVEEWEGDIVVLSSLCLEIGVVGDFGNCRRLYFREGGPDYVG
jgi:hypothetical protein